MTAPDPTPFASLAADVPIVLLPVRIETRFGHRVATIDGGEMQIPTLAVRVYPDDITVDSHDPTVTDDEVEAGRTFWSAHSAATDKAATNRDMAERARWTAWEMFVGAVGVDRVLHVSASTRDPGVQPVRRTGPRSVPRARLLPDRWVVTGWVGGRRLFAESAGPVRPDLAVAPATRGDGSLAIDPTGAVLFDDDSRWVADLPAAIDAGMALVIDLDSPVEVIDRLFVFGIHSPDDADPDRALADLLRAHAATAAAGFVSNGVPTNNLGDARSAWSSAHDLADLLQRATAPVGTVAASSISDGSAAGAMALAMGLPATVFDHFAAAGDNDRLHAGLMAEALFPVTWGEVLTHLVLPAGIDATKDGPLLAQIDAAHLFVYDHVRHHVRGGGPLTSLRLGHQPYGVLPITDTSSFVPQAGEPAMLHDLRVLLDRLWPFWSRAANESPALAAPGAGLDDVARRLLQVLALGPVPHPGAYEIRSITGTLYSKVFSSTHPNLFGIETAAGPMADDTIDAITAHATIGVLRTMIGAIPPAVHRSLLAGMTIGVPELVRFPVAQDNPARAGAPRVSDYLRALGSWRPPFQSPTPWGAVDPPRDLLYQLVHRSLALAAEQSSLALLREIVGPDDRFFLDVASISPEISALGLLSDAAPDVARASVMPMSLLAQLSGRTIDESPGAGSIIELIGAPERMGQFVIDQAIAVSTLFPQTDLFRSTSDAVAALGAVDLDPEVYTRLVGEYLATATTRIDAWYTSLATQRLATIRAARPTGSHVGSFGWVVDLRRDDDEVASGPAGWEAPGAEVTAIVAPRSRVGWVHAPSLDQATTGALLRGGELAHGDGGAHVARLDLTSNRVRAGSWILNAVHRGQPLGAILGYRLERLFHDRSNIDTGLNLHRYVDDLRARHPQRSVAQPGDPEQVVPHEVVDGVEAWSAWKAERLTFDQPPSPTEMDAIERIFAEIDGSVEAVSDLLVAEGVHQLASGSLTKAAAMFEAVATGAPPPTDLDVLRAIRRGVSITHRIITLCDAPADGGWADDRPRSRVAPVVESFARRWLGAAAGWSLAGPAGSLTLAELGVSALDVVVEARSAGDDVPALAHRLVAVAGGSADDVPLTDPVWQRLRATAETIGELLTSSRPLTPADITVSAQVADAATTAATPPPSVTAASLVEVEVALSGPAGIVADIREATNALRELIGLPTVEGDEHGAGAEDVPADANTVDLPAVRALLMKLADLGTSSALVSLDASPKNVVASALGAIHGAERAADTASAALSGTSAEPLRRLDALRSAAATLMGASAVVAPTLTDNGDLGGNRLHEPGRFEIEDWLDGSARVRLPLACLGALRLFASTSAGAGADTTVPVVCQLPARDGESWLGGPLPGASGGRGHDGTAPLDPLAAANVGDTATRAWRAPIGPTAHVVVVGGGDALDNGAQMIGGLVLDEWSEVLPSAATTTGVALHYDAPDARAPQSILLAVHPDPAGGAGWSWELVETMLGETLDLARVRLVDLDELAITGIDEYLPAAYVREGLFNIKDLFGLIGDFVSEAGLWTTAALAANRGGGA